MIHETLLLISEIDLGSRSVTSWSGRASSVSRHTDKYFSPLSCWFYWTSLMHGHMLLPANQFNTMLTLELFTCCSTVPPPLEIRHLPLSRRAWALCVLTLLRLDIRDLLEWSAFVALIAKYAMRYQSWLMCSLPSQGSSDHFAAPLRTVGYLIPS